MNGDDECGSRTTKLGRGENPNSSKPKRNKRNKTQILNTQQKQHENDRFWGATRTIGFGWIDARVRQSRRWCNWRDEGLRWCDRMGFLGLTNGFYGFDEWVWALLDERARSWVFWVRRSQFLGSISSLSLSLSVRGRDLPLTQLSLCFPENDI